MQKTTVRKWEPIKLGPPISRTLEALDSGEVTTVSSQHLWLTLCPESYYIIFPLFVCAFLCHTLAYKSIRRMLKMVNKKCFNRADYQRIVLDILTIHWIRNKTEEVVDDTLISNAYIKQIIHNMYVLSIINTALYTYIYRLVWPLLSLIQGRRALLCSNKWQFLLTAFQKLLNLINNGTAGTVAAVWLMACLLLAHYWTTEHPPAVSPTRGPGAATLSSSKTCSDTSCGLNPWKFFL